MNEPSAATSVSAPVQLKRALKLWDLIIIGIVIIQPIAPMGIYGVINNNAGGHVVTTILIAMVAMLFTAISYGKMARAYPSAGSAYTYVGEEIHPALGYITGWAMVMDYILNPLICTVLCSKLTQNILPGMPYWALAVAYATLFTLLNLRGIKTSARINDVLAAGMSIVVVVFFAFVIRFIWGLHQYGAGFFTQPFYNPQTFSFHGVFRGTSIAVLTYIGFDAISTLSEEVENPRRNVMLATVLVCVITGILSSLEVYAAQLVWGSKPFPPDMVESAFPLVARQIGGFFLFHLLNFTVLIANIGSGMGAQLGAARLLFGMGRSDGIPKKFFGALDPKNRIPRNNVIFVGAIALVGAFLDFLRERNRAAEFWGAARVYGRERSSLRPLLFALERKALDRLRFSGAWLFHLPFYLAQSWALGHRSGNGVDGGWSGVRRRQNEGLQDRSGAL